jgi:lipoprotein LprG
MIGPARTLALAAVLLGVAACTSSKEPLPPGPELVAEAGQAMSAVESVRFSLEVEGALGGIGVRRAEGVLTRAGEGSGTAQLELNGTLIEYALVVTGDTFYLRGPTGGFQAVPRFLASQFYDPTLFLDAESGLPNVLTTATGAETVAAEAVEGTDAYLVDAIVQASLLSDLMPLDPGQETVPASLWIGRDRPVLLRVRVEAEGEEGASTLTLTLSDFDAPVTVTPPP